ncbi:MAG TPA: hypothetical protein VK819_18360 [Acidobacteriaceae bacterium]|jgi:hypothetical protein|nr:hypothetical protein [Acidobacteriaceae bacterium]
MDGNVGVALFGFLAVGAVALFSMVAVASWASARQKERESYYKNDMLKKVAESQGPGVTSTLELMREEAKINAFRAKQGLKIAGLILTATGIGLLIFLHALITDAPIYLVGVLVLLIGAALFASSYVVTAPVE